MYTGLHVKYLLFLSHFKATWILSTDFRGKTPTPNFMKICPVGAELFHAEGRETDRQIEITMLIDAFRHFANAPNNNNNNNNNNTVELKEQNGVPQWVPAFMWIRWDTGYSRESLCSSSAILRF